MSTRLAIKVVPGSSDDCIVGWLGKALKLRVRAPPERGKANAAVARILAEALGIPERRVCVVKGKSSTRKIVEISNLQESELLSRLAENAAAMHEGD